MAAVLHTPVLLEEALEALQVKPGGWYVDATVGSGGHALAILARSSPGGRLLGIDADPQAVGIARSRLPSSPTILVHGNFAHLDIICALYDFRPVEGILLDLGLSSMQLSEKGRGFSFQQDDPLDMRFDPEQELSAAYLVNNYSEVELSHLLHQFGEERYSRKVARRIVQHRPINTTQELSGAVMEAVGGRRGHLHPATRTFQALRIAVNRELENLASALRQSLGLLRPEGRLVVLSYHSLEDRLVKEFMRRESRGCLCPASTPVCICGHQATLKLVTPQPIVPSPQEVSANPRSRSAKLRAAERI